MSNRLRRSLHYLDCKLSNYCTCTCMRHRNENAEHARVCSARVLRRCEVPEAFQFSALRAVPDCAVNHEKSSRSPHLGPHSKPYQALLVRAIISLIKDLHLVKANEANTTRGPGCTKHNQTVKHTMGGEHCKALATASCFTLITKHHT